jgi:hypothetical protein
LYLFKLRDNHVLCIRTLKINNSYPHLINRLKHTTLYHSLQTLKCKILPKIMSCNRGSGGDCARLSFEGHQTTPFLRVPKTVLDQVCPRTCECLRLQHAVQCWQCERSCRVEQACAFSARETAYNRLVP